MSEENRLRIVFCGTPDFAVPSLKMLIESDYEVVGVFCQPDRPVGRKQLLQAPPVKQVAQKHGIPVCQFEDMRREEGLKALRELAPDLMVTAAFGQILSQENLDVPAMGTVNVHGSLLPKYRGAAPIQWAIIDGLEETGVTILYTVLALDAGDMLLHRSLAIGSDETAGELFDRVSALGAETLKETIDGLIKGELHEIPQDESQATRCRMLKKEDGNIDWGKSSQRIHNLIRGLNPWPGAFTFFSSIDAESQEQIKVWRSKMGECPQVVSDYPMGVVVCANSEEGLWIRTGDGALELTEIQTPGGKRMNAKDFLRGHSLMGGVCSGKKDE